jgi:hypothetical protein
MSELVQLYVSQDNGQTWGPWNGVGSGGGGGGLPPGTDIAPGNVHASGTIQGDKTLYISGSSTLLGAVKIGDGTVTFPALSFNNQNFTGIYRDVAVNPQGVSFAANGVKIIAVDPNGITGYATTSGGFRIGMVSNTLGGLSLSSAAAGASTLDLDPIPDNGTAPATDASTIRLFRNVNTTGVRVLQLNRGDGTNTIEHNFNMQAGGGVMAVLARNGGRVLIGTATDDGTDVLQVGGDMMSNGRLRAADGSSTLPSLSFTSASGVGLYRPAAGSILGFCTSAVEQMRLMSGADANLILGMAGNGAQVAAGQGLVEINGSSSSQLGFDIGGVPWANLHVTTAQMAVGHGSNVTLVTGGAEKARVTSSTDATFLVGQTVPSLNVNGRGLVEISGASQAAVGVSVAGTWGGYLFTAAGATELGASAGRDLRFVAGGRPYDVLLSQAGVFLYGGFEVGYRGSPVVVRTGNLLASDNGKLCRIDVAGNINLVTGTFIGGNVVHLYNNTGAAITLTQGTSTSIKWGVPPVAGNRTLAAGALAHLYFWTTDSCILESTAGVT